jgi:hypothetical protein
MIMAILLRMTLIKFRKKLWVLQVSRKFIKQETRRLVKSAQLSYNTLNLDGKQELI